MQKKKLVCKTCKIGFYTKWYKPSKPQKFCSRKCIRNKTQFAKGQKIRLGIKPPEIAWNNQNSIKTRFYKGHSLGFKKGFTPWNKGKDFGGLETLKRKIIGLSMYKKWRNEIRERDGYKCVRCKMSDIKLEVDHYPISFAKLLKENNILTVEDARQCKKLWDKNNARTLCKHCHKEVTYWQQARRDCRKLFMDALLELAEKDDKIVLIIPDVGFSYMEEFEKRFPNRFFNFGVTEQSTILIASAMALSGFKPFVFSMINFVLFRPAEMVRNGIVKHNSNVKLIGTSGSKSFSFLGFSHNLLHENEDTIFCKNIGLKWYTPKLYEVKDLILKLSEEKTPSYIRL